MASIALNQDFVFKFWGSSYTPENTVLSSGCGNSFWAIWPSWRILSRIPNSLQCLLKAHCSDWWTSQLCHSPLQRNAERASDSGWKGDDFHAGIIFSCPLHLFFLQTHSDTSEGADVGRGMVEMSFLEMRAVFFGPHNLLGKNHCHTVYCNKWGMISQTLCVR